MDNKIDLDVVDFIEDKLLIKINDSEIINRGLLNLKWKVSTDQGILFLKIYHPLRYNEKKLEEVNVALFYYNKINSLGFKCPKLFNYNGNHLLKTNLGNNFILTEYSTGYLITPGKINENQAYCLGEEIGKMHDYTNRFDIYFEKESWKIPTKETLLEKWKYNWSKLNQTVNKEFKEVLKKQKQIFEKFDLSQFAKLKPTLAHNDLWCDNILFHENSVSSILDFDRFNLTYMELDIARAILSFGLDQMTLRKDIVQAFLKGYNKIKLLSKRELILAIRLCFIRESLGWLGPNIKINNGPPERFKYEMIWIANNWNKLEEVIG
ncbi:phosphotransferase [Mycoplasmatota bacterium]|nr:phosphotransferase [Mycoplasmatota bacterium]